MKLSRSTYYYEIGKTDKIQERNADITSKIESIFQEHKGRYGVRRVCQELAWCGFPVNHKRVQRIMETFFGRLKNEMFYGYEKEYTSFEVFSKAIADYIDYYNNRRIQAKTKWMPPVKFREASMMKNELFSSTGAVQIIGYISDIGGAFCWSCTQFWLDRM